MDLIEKYGWDSDIPCELTDFVKTRKGYDYKDHSRVGAAHGEFVTDEICDRFCVIGTAEQCTTKLRELEAVGVDQFNIYLMTNGQEEMLEAYGREIIPGFAAEPRLSGVSRHDELTRPGRQCGTTSHAGSARATPPSTLSAASRSTSARRARRRHGPVRLRQVDADAHPRRARQADLGHGHHRRRGRSASCPTRDVTLLRRKHIGFVFQFFNLLPMLSAEENILLPLSIAGEKPDKAFFEDLLKRVGLADRRTHRPSELSGGQQQRVAIARVARLEADGRLRRRADGQPRLADEHRDPRAAARVDRGVRPDDRDGDPRRRAPRRSPTGSSSWPTG